jgi:hypothetical protein
MSRDSVQLAQIRITVDCDALATHLARLDGLIVFDGYLNAGKSTLATVMAGRLGCPHVDGDDHADRRGTYVDALRLDELHAAIRASLRVAPRVILHCVCARAVLARLGLAAAAVVYVQHDRPPPLGGTASNRHYDALCAEAGGFAAHDRPGLDALERELLLYHAEYRPSATADIHYTWIG